LFVLFAIVSRSVLRWPLKCLREVFEIFVSDACFIHVDWLHGQVRARSPRQQPDAAFSFLSGSDADRPFGLKRHIGKCFVLL
jgi:hypothetical protein